MKSRRVFGSTLRGERQQVECYERIHTGLGDGVMLRPAIIANMKRYPDRRHVLHIYKGVACIFEDIEGLEIVPISHPDAMLETKRQTQYRYRVSLLMASSYNISNMYALSDPCALYESQNSPFNSTVKEKTKLRFSRQGEYFPTKLPRLSTVRHTTNTAVATGKVITKSRQQIFCDVVGVDLSLDNYDVKFSDEELQVAHDVIGDNNVVGIHMRTSTHQRDYNYMIELVEHVASKVNAVITLDHKWIYKGKRSNVISSIHGIREKWAIISRLKMLIGPDSFAVHAAGAVGIPTYGIFGPTDPECRLAHYKNVAWSGKWKLPTLRGGPKLGCGRQYCWYKTCRFRGCLNARSPRFYWNDAISKLQPGV